MSGLGANEVCELLDLTPENQRVLMLTAIASSITPSDAAALTGNDEAPRLLEYLYQHHLFTDRRRGEPFWRGMPASYYAAGIRATLERSPAGGVTTRTPSPAEEWARRRLPAVREYIQDEFAARMRAAVPKDTIEVGTSRQPPASRLRSPGTSTDQTVNRVRPFARRRFSVCRPARVCIRLRNPCVRARLRFFG